MKFGIIGLGRIGGNPSLQAIEKGHQVVGYSLSQKELDSFSQKGMVTVPTVNDLVKKLKPPRIVFIYISHGDPMDSVTLELMEHLESGDIVVDGGNSFWKKPVKRYADFKGQ
jgi:6-phosphogluconate dehydrogenase